MVDDCIGARDAYSRTDIMMESLTVNYLLMLGRMSESYKLEKTAFLKQLQSSHGTAAGKEKPSGAAPNSPHAAAAAKRPRIGTWGSVFWCEYVWFACHERS